MHSCSDIYSFSRREIHLIRGSQRSSWPLNVYSNWYLTPELYVFLSWTLDDVSEWFFLIHEYFYFILLLKYYLSYFFIFCLRKIHPELMSVPVFLCFVCGSLPQHGWWVMWVCTWDLNLEARAAEVHHAELATKPWGQPCISIFWEWNQLYAAILSLFMGKILLQYMLQEINVFLNNYYLFLLLFITVLQTKITRCIKLNGAVK